MFELWIWITDEIKARRTVINSGRENLCWDLFFLSNTYLHTGLAWLYHQSTNTTYPPLTVMVIY